jgi:hypothetical protein
MYSQNANNKNNHEKKSKLYLTPRDVIEIAWALGTLQLDNYIFSGVLDK